MSNNTQKYDTVTVLLHWLIGIGIFAIAGLELVREGFPKGSFLRDDLKALHQPAGTIIFCLILLRLDRKSVV